MESIKGKVAIVGIGEVPTGRYADRPAMLAACQAAKQAIEDAGITKDDIDMIMPTGSLHDPYFNSGLNFGLLVESLGLQGKANNLYIFTGGSSSAMILKAAAGLIATGIARIVLCLQADKLATSQQRMGGQFTGGNPEWTAPYGHMMNATAALVAQRYIYETGTTPEQMASVCVALRKWAELNPNAMFRKPLTVEEILNSKMIASPYHMYECNMLADGASAFVVTSAERARDITKTPVYLLGVGGRYTHRELTEVPDITRLGFVEAAQEAYQMAGIGPEDVDIAEIYDAYPAFVLIALEGLGLCPRGRAGRFVAEGNTWPGGKLPMTTNGGMLSQGHTGAGGGFAVMVEAARQLMGKAGKRQVKDAKIAVETSSGGDWCDSQVTILGKEIP